MAEVHLQGIYGKVPAKKIKDFKVGEKLRYNFGETTTIINIQPTKSGKSRVMILQDDKSKKKHTRRFKSDTYWAIGK